MQYKDKKEEERYKKLFANFYCSTPEVNDLMEYLAGQRDALSSNISNMNSYCYRFIRNSSYRFYEKESYTFEFEKEYETDAELRELANRLFQILCEHAPNLLMQFFSLCNRRYYYYKQSNLPQEFLLQDVAYILTKIRLHRNSAIIEGKKWDFKIITDCFLGLYKDAPEVLEKIRDFVDASEEEMRLVSYLLAAYEKEIPKLEEKIFPRIYEHFLSRKDSIDWVVQQLETSLLAEFETITMCEDFMTEKMKQYAGLIFAICPGFIFELPEYRAKDTFDKLCDSIGAPMEAKLCYYFHINRRDYYDSLYKRINYEKLRQALSLFTQENKKEIYEMLQRLLERKDYAAIYSYGMCKKKGLLTEEENKELLSSLKELLFFKLQKFYIEQKTQEFFQFTEDCEEGDFRSLSESNLKQKKIFIDAQKEDWIRFSLKLEPFINACVILVEELPEAINMLTLFVTAFNRYQIQNCSLPETYFYYLKEKNNPLELFYNNHISFDIVCKIGLADVAGYYITRDREGYDANNCFTEFIQNHKQEAVEFLEKRLEDMMREDSILDYIKVLYERVQGARKEYLVPLLKKTKKIAEYAERLLQTRQTEEVRKQVEEMIEAGKPKAAVDAAMRLIGVWDNEKIERELKGLTTKEEFVSYIEKKYGKNNEKNVPYPKEIDFSQVRFQDSEELAPDIVLKFYVSEYINLKELHPIKFCEEMISRLNPYDLLELLRQIYEKWLSEGAAAKFKNILLPYALHSGTAKLEDLKKQIGEWAENRKPALALLGTQCIALNGSKEAFLLIDTMSKKHKNKKVRKAALEALEFAREKLGLSKEEMEDRMVPDLGFQNRKRIFSYGQRSFETRLLPDLSIVLYDGEKEIKSLPKASAKFEDEEQKVKEAKEELKALKKQVGLIVEAQKARMERAIYSGRKWTKERWLSLFLENPFLLRFATGLIWEELSQSEDILGVFRYMEDGSFNTREEEEYELSENTFIRLLYPSDITEEEVEEWREQLEDYEIVQPTNQLSLPVLRIKEEDREKKTLCNIEGCKVYGPTIKSIATKMSCQLSYTDWQCDGFFYEFPNEGLFMTLDCKPFDPGDYTIVVELEQIQFLRSDDRKTPLRLIEVPGRVLGFAKQIEDMLLAKQLKKEE